jgi:multidrug efflux pump subunit AcrA (membrane-fusion protein)
VQIDGRSKESATFEARARVEGILEPLDPDFHEGALVTGGQLLFVIEQEPFESALNAAEAQLKAAKAQKESAIALEGTAKAQQNSAEAAYELADAEYDRTLALFNKQVATQSELDLRDAQKKVAFANIDTAKAALDDADAAKLVAEAAIDRETANVEQAKIELSYTKIHSPMNGLVGEVLVDPGNIVGKGENSLLTTVRQIDPLDIYFEVPERTVLQHLRAIYEGRREENRDVLIEVQFEGEEGYPHKGELVLVDNQVDPSTGTTLLKGEIRNPYRESDDNTGAEIPFKERQYLLRPGAYAKIRVKTEPIPDAVLVHETAVGTDLTGKYLLIVNEKNKVELRRVRLGQRYHQFRHIEAMWKPDEPEPETTSQRIDTDFRYVLDGLLRARPGITVDVTEEIELTYPDDEPAVSVEVIDQPGPPAENEDEDDSNSGKSGNAKTPEESNSQASPKENSEAVDSDLSSPESGPPKES